MDRLEIICEEGWNFVYLLSEEGVRKLSKFRILGDTVEFYTLDKEVPYSIGVMNGGTLMCLKPEICREGATFKDEKRFIVYLFDGKPRYLLNARKGLVVRVE